MTDQATAASSSKLLLLNGPNLNLLGMREPDIYGYDTLPQIEHHLELIASAHQLSLSCYQSNHEGQLIDAIHQAKDTSVDFIVFNPGGFTHTSIALRDALLGVEIPFIEVHLSNPLAREPFRHPSYFSDIATGVIIGFGKTGYELALEAAIKHLNNVQDSRQKPVTH